MNHNQQLWNNKRLMNKKWIRLLFILILFQLTVTYNSMLLFYKNSMTMYYKYIQQIMRIDKRRYEKSVENNLKF